MIITAKEPKLSRHQFLVKELRECPYDTLTASQAIKGLKDSLKETNFPVPKTSQHWGVVAADVREYAGWSTHFDRTQHIWTRNSKRKPIPAHKASLVLARVKEMLSDLDSRSRDEVLHFLESFCEGFTEAEMPTVEPTEEEIGRQIDACTNWLLTFLQTGKKSWWMDGKTTVVGKKIDVVLAEGEAKGYDQNVMWSALRLLKCRTVEMYGAGHYGMPADTETKFFNGDLIPPEFVDMADGAPAS
jgi:hypothetical protein